MGQIGFSSSSSINGLEETLGCESLPLSRIRSIKDEVLRFYQVVREEAGSRDLVRSIVNQCLRCCHASIEVYREYLISAIITIQMNS